MSQQLTFVVLTTGNETAQELRGALTTDRRVRLIAMSDRAEQVYAEVIRSRPSAVIITIGDQPEQTWSLCRRIQAVNPDTVIICALKSSSPDLIIDSLRVGAREFLRLPLNMEEFKTVLDRTAEISLGDSKVDKKNGQVIAVFSTKGGCGNSFIATNLAVVLDAPTVLVDLNLQAGDLDIFFGIQPQYSINDLIANRVRLDEGLISSFLTLHSENLAILPAPRHAEMAEDVKPEHIAEAIRVLRERYDYVLLDLPHVLDANTLAALDQADDIILVLNLDLLSVRGAQRALSIFDRVGYPRHKMRLVINRASRQRELDLPQIERYLGESVTCIISADPAAALSSVNEGRPLSGTPSNSPIVTEIRRLAAAFGHSSSTSDDEPRRGLLGAILKKTTDNLGFEFRSLNGKAPAES